MTTPRFTRPLLAAALFALAGATQSLAVDSKDNAALAYWRAFSLVSMASVAFESEGVTRPDFVIQDEFTRRLVQSPAIVDRLIEAAAKPDCDFAIEFEKGPDALMPQLGPMRAAVRVLILRARVDLDRGDINHATECLVAALRSARHVVRDQVLISSLVGTMLLSDAMPLLEYAMTNEMLQPEHVAQLRDALAAISGDDPFQAVAAMKTEHAMTSDWIKSLRQDQDIVKRIREFGGDAEATRRLEESLARGSDVRDGLHLYDIYMTQSIAALERRDEEKIQALGQALKAGAFGELAQVIAPSFDTILRNMNSGEKLLVSLRETLAR